MVLHTTVTGWLPSGDLTTLEGISRRGYTGHSMLGRMELIHMNGRVQDAVTGRFLSPDPTIPNAGFTQSYNRYAYVNNNPMSYIDPSGFTPDYQSGADLNAAAFINRYQEIGLYYSQVCGDGGEGAEFHSAECAHMAQQMSFQESLYQMLIVEAQAREHAERIMAKFPIDLIHIQISWLASPSNKDEPGPYNPVPPKELAELLKKYPQIAVEDMAARDRSLNGRNHEEAVFAYINNDGTLHFDKRHAECGWFSCHRISIPFDLTKSGYTLVYTSHTHVKPPVSICAPLCPVSPRGPTRGEFLDEGMAEREPQAVHAIQHYLGEGQWQVYYFGPKSVSSQPRKKN